MPFAITHVPTGVQTAGTKKLVIAQPRATQQALLYGVEMSCQNGFSADPQADIYVFNNPKAAEYFVKTIDPTYSFETNKLKMDPDLDYSVQFIGKHIVTAQRGQWNQYIPMAPIGICGTHYCDDAVPYVTDVDPDGWPSAKEAYLTVVIVINNVAAVTDTVAVVKAIYIHS